MSDCDVKEFKLCELLKIYNGTKYDHLNKGDIPLYGSGGLMSHVNEALYSGEAILLPRKGTLSNIMYVNESFWTVDTMYYAVVNDKLADAFYLYSYLSQLDLSNLDSGSTLPSMTKSAYESIVVKLPDLKIQKAVATILFNIRKKLETNNKINQELEAMAKTLYDYWFVQFDFPNEEGKPYKSSGGEMVWNEKLKREIPIDWEVLSLFDAVSVQYGFPFATEQFTEEETNVPVVRIRDILEGTTSAYSLEKADEKYHLNENDVLVGMDGNFHMNFWHDNIAYLNQRCVRLRAHSDSTISSIQILHSIKPYIKAKEQNAKGSTVGHLSDKDLKGLYLIKPLKTRAFNPRKTLDGLLALVIENKKQILSLTKQRDELLPLLINGQITIE